MESMAVKKMKKKGFLSVAQVAKAAGVSASTVYYSIRHGALETLKVGSTNLISPSKAKKFVSQYSLTNKMRKGR